MKTHAAMLTEDHLTVSYPDGDVITLYRTDAKWDDAIDLLRENDYDGIRELANAEANNILSYGEGRVTIQDGLIMLDSNPVENVLVDRMLAMLDLGLDVEPLANFLVNLYDNPDYRAVRELYGFLEASDLTITGDGHFLAYKRIREDYMDIYTGKMDNSIGTLVSMHRNEVNNDKTKTCSAGLHFCGRDYLSSYGAYGNGYRTVVIKINPRDVVSIPVDYNNHKGRCCLYEVVGELEHNNEAPLEGTVNFDYDDDEDFAVRYQEGVDDISDWTPEAEPEQIEDTFPTRSAARDYTRKNTAYVVRDRGPGHPNRWYVALRSGE